MKNWMTIKEFSTKTGIPKSTLRFYEEKNLLKSVREEDSNYRLYSEDQVSLAKLIASLRTANIPVRDIQLYLKSDATMQKQMKQKWIRMIKENLRQLEISLRYLESDQGEEAFYVMKKPSEKVIWFKAEAPTGEFAQAFISRGRQLKQHRIPINNTYVRYISGNRKSVIADIGFGVPGNTDASHIPDAFSENMEESLCIGLSFNGELLKIDAAYRKLIQYCMTHNWAPSGSILEWNRGGRIDATDIIIPVLGGNK